MKRTILSVCTSFFVLASALLNNDVSAQRLTPAQSIANGEQIEQINYYWENVKSTIYVKFKPSGKDVKAFYRFDEEKINTLKLDFFKKVKNANLAQEKTGDIIKETAKSLCALYEGFVDISHNYPSTVAEYTGKKLFTTNPCDSSGCTNMDFNQGTLNTWYGYYAIKEDSCASNSISLTAVGGLLGAVTEACNDPATAAYNALTDDYQISLTSSGYDAIVPTIPRVSPWASGGHSVMIGDSTWVGFGVAILEKTFLVTASTANLTYQYAVFLENPGHCIGNQPLFTVAALDENGDTIPNCGEYNVTSGYGTNTFDSTTYIGTKTYYRNWTIVNVPLKNYVGQCVTIIFEVRDCGQGGHFGYAYVDASCSPLGLISSSPNFCGQDSISLTAPPGAQSYAWTGPTNGILTDTTKQTIWVDSAGVYSVVTIPVTGAQCADTIKITLNKLPGPPPVPTFTADTVCAGKPTQFKNTSDSTKGIFSWDFYNIGNYNYRDTNNFNPTWTYINPGIYVVKLNEVLKNGCGANVYDTIIVDTNVANPTFTASPTCLGDTTYFTPNAPGATTYDWNFGEPSSGTHDSSKYRVPGHKYATAGTFKVTFKADNRGGCGAIDTQLVTIYSVPIAAIRGKDTICPGTPDTLFASGGTSYLWNNTFTKSYLAAAPTVTTTYTLEAFNGTCSDTIDFTIVVVPAPVPVISSSKDSACKGDTLTIWGSGGTTYKWSSGQTTTALHVTLDSTTTFKLYEKGGTCLDSISLKIPVIPAITADTTIQFDSICPGDNDILTATGVGGQATYSWSTGATISSITVSPTTTTTYTATIIGLCNSIKKPITVRVVPLPAPVITGQNWECRGATSTLTVTSSGKTTYLWSNGKTTTTITTVPITANTTYTVYAANSLGCKDSITYTVDLRDPPGIIVTPPALACAGNSVTLIATGSGQGPFTYTWEPGGATTDSISVNPTTKTTYTVTVSNGCNSTKTTIVTPDSPTLSACCDKTILIGEDTTIVAGGPKMRSYSWAPDSGVVCLNPPLCDSIKVTPTVTTTYTVTGTDSLGCQVERLVTITIEIPCFSLNIPNVFTPDNKGALGLDNIFYIKTENITGWSLIIYDRWGKEMYNSTNPDEFWTGTTKGGANAPDGVYYYIVTGTCQSVTYKKDGFVQLIR